MTPFHLAFGVRDLDSTRAFFGDILGCKMGRNAPTWQDFDFFGHQLSAHLSDVGGAGSGSVDGQSVPIPHFGAVLGMTEWNALAERVRAKGVAFLIDPQVRFAGSPGEQGTFFLQDPSGNTLEFKGFRNPEGIFAVRDTAAAPQDG